MAPAFFQRIGGGPAVLGDLGQKALGGDEGIAILLGRLLGADEDPGGFRFSCRVGPEPLLDARNLGQDGVDFGGRLFRPAAGALHQGARQAVLFFKQNFQQVLRAKLLVAAGQRQRLGRDWIACLARSE